MKKKSLKYFLSIFIVSVFSFINVYAIDLPQKARVPNPIPDKGDKLFAITDKNKFNFSKVYFKDNAGNKVNEGKDNMKKILLSNSFIAKSSNPDLMYNDKFSISETNNWFSAYCLDGKKKYPENGYAAYQDSTNNAVLAQRIVLSALYNETNNNKKLYDFFKDKSSYLSNYSDSVSFDRGGNNTDYEFIKSVLEGTTKEVDLKSVTFRSALDPSKELAEVKADDINEALSLPKNGKYTLKLSIDPKEANFIFDVYSTDSINTEKYNRALWIIENSYPTLTIEQTLLNAGANYNTLLEEIEALEGGNLGAPIDEYVENYVYSTIQYAIWKIYDGIDEKIGDELVGSIELNKLFRYLVDGSKIVETTAYVSGQADGSLTILKSDAKFVKKKENNKLSLKYGPYEVMVNSLNNPDIKLSVESNGLNVKILNEQGAEVSSINQVEKFYVLIDNITKEQEKKLSEKIAGVKIKATGENILTLKKENTSRIYYAMSPLIQNVITGGLTENNFKSDEMTLVYNPETGVQNIAILFIITLISFSIGYLVLNYKNQSLEL